MKYEDKDRRWLPTAPEIEKSVGLPLLLSIVQLTSPPAPAGRGSLRASLDSHGGGTA